MSQNPYAAGIPSDYNQAPPRTSVMAILSLISSLLCCVPGLFAIGTLLGVVAMFRIKGSNGQRKGMGLAMAGIIIGIVVGLIQLIGFYIAWSGMKEVTRMMAAPVTMMSTTDPSKVRAALSPTLGGQVSDADWARFQSAITAELGTLQPMPTNMISFFQQYGEVGQMMQNQQNQNAMPIPLIGDKGKGVLLLHMPQRGSRTNPPPGTTPGEMFLMISENISVLLPSGQEVWLVDPDQVKTAPVLPRGSGPGGSKPTN